MHQWPAIRMPYAMNAHTWPAGHLAVCDSATVRKLLGQDVLSAMNTLVMSDNQDNQLCGLHVLSSLAGNSDDVSEEVLTDTLLKRLYQLIQEGKRV